MVIPVLEGIDVVYEEWEEESDNFYIHLNAYISEKGSRNPYDYELFTFHIISPKRLAKNLNDTLEIDIGRGYLITCDYSLSRIENKIKQLLTNCKRENWDEVIHAINRYGIWAEES